MTRYYCLPIKKYVYFIVDTVDGYLRVLMVAHTTGVVIGYITMPFSTGRQDCAYINNKDYPWLYNWLIEKGIANPTYRRLNKDGFGYAEFKFKKGI